MVTSFGCGPIIVRHRPPWSSCSPPRRPGRRAEPPPPCVPAAAAGGDAGSEPSLRPGPSAVAAAQLKHAAPVIVHDQRVALTRERRRVMFADGRAGVEERGGPADGAA